MTITTRLLALILFGLSLAAGFSAGGTYAESRNAPVLVVEASELPERRAFPSSEDMLREMAVDMMRTQGLSTIEPASGESDAAPAR